VTIFARFHTSTAASHPLMVRCSYISAVPSESEVRPPLFRPVPISERTVLQHEELVCSAGPNMLPKYEMLLRDGFVFSEVP